ncbi:MAG: RNA polymerase sigma factor [Bacteroidaceae bacterium]|jgi:RNA polymerase sigma-70 factor (ECF subfamily)|nr:RNA polymerase sigma factor [Bacteroidaceae bacterium]MCR4836331.1 RNA polymerase sigma factor [Bacteroidaceae bacterium]
MKEISFKNDVLPLKDKLFRLALRITLNREEAEDIVQDTLMKLWNQRDEWSAIQNMETYSMTICRNLSLDAIEKKERLNISLDETVHDRPDTSRTQDEELMKQQQLNTVMRIIGQLPEKQRTIMQLRDIEGKSYQEIADIMSINVSDVKVNLFRARQKVLGSVNKES